ncbi:methyltransferase domain-containing protein [Endozoicomonas sp.]|uniref:methyltransferase domain-containing protein n=1 Tax=Endozoicomonas sp. TaxID=1892382 RepID=UPI00383AD71D
MILDTTTTNKTGGCCKSSSFNREISVEDNSCKKLPSKNESAHKPEGVSCSKDPARTKDLPGRSCCGRSSNTPTCKTSRNESAVTPEKYYNDLGGNENLQTGACRANEEKMPEYLQEPASKIPEEINENTYGCGFPFSTTQLKNMKDSLVVDLGCGAGRDVYLYAFLVGEGGRATGIDTSKNQLAIAKKYQLQMAEAYGYQNSNTEFIEDKNENLINTGIKISSVDIFTSNCVLNLSDCPEKIFSAMLLLLKANGTVYLSDVFPDKPVSDEIKNDDELRNECLAGNTWEHTKALLNDKTPSGYRLTFKEIASDKIKLANPNVEKKVDNITYYSKTIEITKVAENPQEQEKPA